MSFGPTEWLIVLGVLTILFGAKKIPEVARSMGRSIKEFRVAAEDRDTDETMPSGQGGKN